MSVCLHVPPWGFCEIVSDLPGWGWGSSDMGMDGERAGILAVIADLGPNKLFQI